MKSAFHKILFLIGALVLCTTGHANKGGGGGDMCEDRIKQIRDDLKSWIVRGGAAQLILPAEISLEIYTERMLTAIRETKKIVCQSEPVYYGSAEKTCRYNVSEQGEADILCNAKRFNDDPVDEQYRQVHHEFGGIAKVEVSDGEDSNYEVSNQISAFLEDHVVKKLAVKPSIRAVLGREITGEGRGLSANEQIYVAMKDAYLTPTKAKKRLPLGSAVYAASAVQMSPDDLLVRKGTRVGYIEFRNSEIGGVLFFDSSGWGPIVQTQDGKDTFGADPFTALSLLHIAKITNPDGSRSQYQAPPSGAFRSAEIFEGMAEQRRRGEHCPPKVYNLPLFSMAKDDAESKCYKAGFKQCVLVDDNYYEERDFSGSRPSNVCTVKALVRGTM